MASIAIVIPCYRVKRHIAGVIARIGPQCDRIFVVDDCCPEGSGRYVLEHVNDPRVTVLLHEKNQGVGGAMLTGFRAALDAGAEIVVKLDGDGQMDPALLGRFVAPLLCGSADYTKGNRFYSVYNVRQMPGLRLFGNAVLSFFAKVSSGYWSIFDPNNGYTAIHATALRQLEFKNISRWFFFESDMLINLGGVRAVVQDIPMEAVYEDENSNLKVTSVIGEFLARHIRAFAKRILYTYFLRDFNLASLHLVAGLVLSGFGAIFGIIEWWRSAHTGIPATTGSVMIAALPIILGFQLLLNFFGYDISMEPRTPLQEILPLATSPDDGRETTTIDGR